MENTKMHTKYGKVWGNDKTLRETCIINVFEFHKYQKAKTYETRIFQEILYC